MKNNKGFTLVELLVTIGLIGAIGVVVGFSVTNLLNSQKGQKYEEYKKTLEDATCVLAQRDNKNLNGVICSDFPSECKVKIGELVNEGLIKKNLVNPKTDKSVEAYLAEDWPIDDQDYIQVTNSSDGLRTCTFQCVEDYCNK